LSVDGLLERNLWSFKHLCLIFAGVQGLHSPYPGIVLGSFLACDLTRVCPR
jgi:hypothetical protein